MSMEDNRKSFRIKRPLLIRFHDSSEKQYTICITDINETGLRFLSPVPFIKSGTMDFLLKLPNCPNQWQGCKGEVLESVDITKYPGAFITGFRTRLRFTSLLMDTAKFLKEYCEFAFKQDQALNNIFEKQLGVLEKDKERRGGVRINKFFVAMYAELTDLMPKDWDITMLRNISTGGTVFTAKALYKNFTHLRLILKLPSRPFNWLDFDVRVVESRQLKNLEDLVVGGTFLTRAQFITVPIEQREFLEEYIDWFVKNLSKNKGY